MTEVILEAHKNDSKANQFWKDEHDAKKNDNPKRNENKTNIFCKNNDDLSEDLNEKIIEINFPLPGWQRLT